MKRSLLFAFCLFILFPVIANAAIDCLVIEQDTTWSGQVAITEDVLIREGVTLSVAPGTEITISASESTKTDPEYLSSLTEITVRGELKALGTAEAPIRFIMPESGQVKGWAGILTDGGSVTFNWVEIEGAESGLSVISGSAEVNNSTLRNNRYGLSVVKPEARVSLLNSSLIENDYGMALLNGAVIEQKDCRIRDNKQKDILQSIVSNFKISAPKYKDVLPDKKSVYTNESLLGTVVWKDRVVIKGVVRVPAKSKLIIMPGTVVEFSKRDTNADGFGENGMLVMGMLVAKGTAEKPIVFRSAEENKVMGDWDAINIYSSDGVQNIIEHCRIENAYRALHFHFSNVAVRHSVLHDNFRALQFQESMIDVSYNDIYDNKSAIRARDSEVIISHNKIYNNYTGPNIFRITGQVFGNTIAGNFLDGLRIREGALQVNENYLVGNRYGLTVAYANYGEFSNNVISSNLETGITLKGTDTIKVVDNFVQANGGNGISLLDTQAVIKGNHLSDNGERGIGVISFNGVISGNNLINNQLYAIGLDGAGDVSAPGNWWGGAVLDEVINDKHDDPAKGTLDYGQPLADPVPYTWPLENILSDTVWYGEIQVPRKVTLVLGSELKIAAGSTVKFAKDSSLWLNGNFEAIGEPQKRITFTALEETSEVYWDQITTEYAEATLVNCDFTNANMGLHSHFSAVHVKGCTFRNNESGFRFRGGPLEISESIFENNVFGMVAYFAKATITDNIITENDIGFLVRRERNRGLTIRHNNIFANARYNLRMGDFNQGQDADARENWWGTSDPISMIFDERREPDVGLVIFEPFAKKRFNLKSPDGATK